MVGTGAEMVSQASGGSGQGPTSPRKPLKSQFTSEEIREDIREQTQRPEVKLNEEELKEAGLTTRETLEVVYEKHHLLVQDLRELFKPIDIDKYTVELIRDEHRWIHNEYKWNEIWKDFFRNPENKGVPKIMAQYESMLQRFGLKGLDLIDYRTGLKLGTKT
jgi:hypothetical protein